MNSLVRYLEGNKADDVLNPRSKLLQINVFSTDSILGKGSSGKYGFGALTYNNGTDVVLNFPNKFTVCFQAKFVDKGFEDTAFGNLISVVFNDTIHLTTRIDESTYNTKERFFVCITRDENNLVEIFINGDKVASDTITEEFNLSSNSFVYIGNQNKYFTGSDVILDDVLILDNKISYLDTVPTGYMDLFRFYQLLYVETETGKVYGYGG